MGDTRISISVKLSENDTSTSVVNLAADSPLTEVVDYIKTHILPKCQSHPMDMGMDMDMDNNCINNMYTFEAEHEHAIENTATTTSSENTHHLCLYDCTLNPPIDITPKVMQYNQPTGPNSITLLSLNWFPSVKLVIFKANDDQVRESVLKSNIHVHEDYQYNLPNYANNGVDTATAKNDIRSVNRPTINIIGLSNGHGKGGSTPTRTLLPSQVIEAAQNRFQSDPPAASMSINHTNPVKRRTEKERKAQIDARLQKLDEITCTKKQSKVSVQVKKMLIKSRAEGDKKIRADDRFYLETVLIDDTTRICDPVRVGGGATATNAAAAWGESTSTYRFYSTASNVGKIVSSATKNVHNSGKNDTMAELLVLVNGKEGGLESSSMYRRLPNTMRIYEAQKSEYLSSFDRVIVRIFSAHRVPPRGEGDYVDHSTPLIGTTDTNVSVEEKAFENFTCQENENVAMKEERSSTNDKERQVQVEEEEIYMKIHAVMSELDTNDKSRKKKKSAATEKVRQILLRGKAKGKIKVPEQDRFYLEIVFVSVSVNADKFNASETPIYISKYDPIEEAAKVLSLKNDSYSILVENAEAGSLYESIPKEIRCIDSGLKPYQRIILKELPQPSNC
jgi:hypothetical protein